MNSVTDQLQPDETIIYRAHPSQLALIVPFLLTAAIIATTAVIWLQTEAAGAVLIGGALALFAVLWLIAKLIALRSNEYVVTSRRIIKQTGIFNKRSTDTYLDKVNNVDHSQTLWGRILGFGNVEVDTASETGTTKFPMVAKPLEFKRAILATAQDFRTAHLSGAAPARFSGAERIRELKALLDDGLISQAEYEEKRKKLLEEL